MASNSRILHMFTRCECLENSQQRSHLGHLRSNYFAAKRNLVPLTPSCIPEGYRRPHPCEYHLRLAFAVLTLPSMPVNHSSRHHCNCIQSETFHPTVATVGRVIPAYARSSGRVKTGTAQGMYAWDYTKHVFGGILCVLWLGGQHVSDVGEMSVSPESDELRDRVSRPPERGSGDRTRQGMELNNIERVPGHDVTHMYTTYTTYSVNSTKINAVHSLTLLLLLSTTNFILFLFFPSVICLGGVWFLRVTVHNRMHIRLRCITLRHTIWLAMACVLISILATIFTN